MNQDGVGADINRGEAQSDESNIDAQQLLQQMRGWAAELGFSQIGVTMPDVGDAAQRLQAWLMAGHHGTMDYMQRHATLRAAPTALVPGTLRVVSVRMDYLPSHGVRGAIGAMGDGLVDAVSGNEPAGPIVDAPSPNASAEDASAEDASAEDAWRDVEWQRLATPTQATVSLYARGRDYHKVMRQRLQQLADRVAAHIGPFGYRAFTDSAPVMEVQLATQAGLAWRGKHTLALSRDAGSMFFLGELFVDVPLPLTESVSAHCGTCTACIDVCPTQAITAPYQLDARRCIAYLTIEHEGAIDESLRPLLGNRIFGCDDCQLACPWNKHAQRARLPDFEPRDAWHNPSLLSLWAWDEATFLQRTEGTVLRRAGFQRWRRNLAVALGNAKRAGALDAPGEGDLQAALAGASPMVAEHILWALAQPLPNEKTHVKTQSNTHANTHAPNNGASSHPAGHALG
jgi:epoxyqueuosine reductase